MSEKCPYRRVADDGRVSCTKIVEGDREVSPAICMACPVQAISCPHLRFSLRKLSPIVVRYNGHLEVWNEGPPRVCFLRAACAAKLMPTDEATCASCSLRTRREPATLRVERVMPMPQPAAS